MAPNRLKRTNLIPLKVSVSATLALLLLAGCTGNQSTTSTTKTNEPAKQPTSSPAETKKQEPLEIQMTARLFEEVPNMDNSYWKEFMKRTNTKLNIEWIPDGDYKTKLN